MDEKAIRGTGSTLSQDDMDRFLALLGPDSDQAGKEYLSLRRRLVAYFGYKGHSEADELADRTLDIAAHRSREVKITNMKGWLHGIARYVSLEDRKSRVQFVPVDPNIAVPSRDDDPDLERTLACLEEGLRRIEPARGDLLRQYYLYDGREKIEHKKKLAAERGMTLANLAVYAFRARQELFSLVKQCADSVDIPAQMSADRRTS